MRATILSGIVFLLISLSGTIEAQDIKYGVILGLDASNFHWQIEGELGDAVTSTSPRISLNFNVYLAYRSNSFWGLAVEPGFVMKGVSYENGSVLKLNYLQIPILGEFYLNDKLALSIGPELAYLVNEQFFQNFELSGALGINYNVYGNFDIGLKYSRGLTYFVKTQIVNQEGYQEFGTIFNQYFQVFGRFRF